MPLRLQKYVNVSSRKKNTTSVEATPTPHLQKKHSEPSSIFTPKEHSTEAGSVVSYFGENQEGKHVDHILREPSFIFTPKEHSTEAGSVVSYFGEIQEGKHVDHVLRDYFPDYSYNGVFFDVGAFEPITISNSHHFHLNGWDVYSFEANPQKVPLLQKHRDHVFNYAITDTDSTEPLAFENVKSRGGWTASYSAIKVSQKYQELFGWNGSINKIETIYVDQRSLNTIIRNEIPDLTHIDIMSLDIEGYELHCLKGLDLERFPPKVIVVENADTNDHSIKKHLETFGYKMDKKVSYNEYYLHKNYFNDV
jgi:FkbM family methyltransferase